MVQNENFHNNRYLIHKYVLNHSINKNSFFINFSRKYIDVAREETDENLDG